MAFRTIVPMSEVTADVHARRRDLWGGPGLPHRALSAAPRHAVQHRRGVPPVGAVPSAAMSAAYRAELEHAYRDAHPTMKALLAMIDLGRRQAVGDRDPIRHWHKGRVVLLGDAAHPTLQSLAQGACMAIEDGLCLAPVIADVPAATMRARLPPVRGGAGPAHGAGHAGIPLSLGGLSRRRHHPGRVLPDAGRAQRKPTRSNAWPGSTTGSGRTANGTEPQTPRPTTVRAAALAVSPARLTLGRIASPVWDLRHKRHFHETWTLDDLPNLDSIGTGANQWVHR